MQVASGLAAAHQQGLVHRDIKPANVLLEEENVERALIADFGLARAADDASLTRTGFHVGTPQYMSPEQASGEAVDQQSDLFSLGSVLYTLCTGQPPFRAETPFGVLRRISDDEPTDIRDLNPHIPDWLCGIICKLMAKQKADRFQSATEVHELLESCLNHVQQPTSVGLPAELAKMTFAKETHKRPIRLVPVLTATAVALAAVLALAVVYYIQTNHGVVQVEVFDESLDVTINDQTVTVWEGNEQPITLHPGPYQLVVSQGETEVLSEEFEITRKDKIVFAVRYLRGEVVVQNNGEEVARAPLPDNTPESSEPAIDTGSLENVAAIETDADASPTPNATNAANPADNLSRVHPSRRVGIEMGVVEQISVTTLADDCHLIGHFTRDKAVLSLNNPTDEVQHVSFNYQVVVYETADREMLILKRGVCDVSLLPRQSHNEVLDLAHTSTEFSADHTKDVALIQVSKGILPLQFNGSPVAPAARHLSSVGSGTSTIAIWDFRERVPFPTDAQAVVFGAPDSDASPFVKVMAAAEESERPGFSGAHEIALSDDEEFLVAGSYGSRMRLWNVEDAVATSPSTGLIGDCTQLGFAPNTSIAWIMDYGGALRIWDAETGTSIRNDFGPSRGEDSGLAPAFSPDGKIMASANRPGKLEFWNLEANELIELHDEPVSRVQFTGDGKYCFTYRYFGELEEYVLSVWDPQTGASVAGPIPDSRVTGSRWGVYGVGSRNGLYSAERSQLFTFENYDALGQTDLVVRSTSQDDWPEIRRVLLPFLAFHAYWLDEEHLLVDGLVPGGNPDRPQRTLHLIPVDATEESQVRVRLARGLLPYRFVLDSAHSRWLDVRTNSVSCWELGGEEPVWSKNIPELNWRVRGVLGAENWILVHDLGGSAFVFDLDDGTELWRKANIRWAKAFGSSIVVGDRHGAEVWRYSLPESADTTAAAADSVPVREEQHTLVIPALAWPEMAVSPDGRKVVAPLRNDSVALWDLGSSQREYVSDGRHSWQISDIAFSPDGSFVATASTDKTALLRDAMTGRRIAVLEGHDDRLSYVTFSPSGRYLFTSSGLNKTSGRIWDGRTGEPVVVLNNHTDVIELARFSGDERLILTGARDNSARLWDIETGEELHRFEHGSIIATAEFSPDWQRILTSSSGRTSRYVTSGGLRMTAMGGGTARTNAVKLWNAQTGEQELHIDQPAGVRASFSSDASQIITVCNGKVTWWDAESGEEQSSMACPGVLQWNTRFTPDGRYLIVMIQDKSAQLWSLSERKQVCEFLIGESLADQISADSRTFYSLSRRGTFRAWGIEPDESTIEAQLIDDAASDALTGDE